MNTGMLQLELGPLNHKFETSSPAHIIHWAAKAFAGRVAVSSSFQSQSLPLLHLIAQHAPQVPVYFIDTGFHFPETLAYRDQLAERLNLNILTLAPQTPTDAFLFKLGRMYEYDPNTCCHMNKVVPFQRGLIEHDIHVWIAGIRRDQTPNRAHAGFIERHKVLPIYKLNPILKLTNQDIDDYIEVHQLPRHPLWEQGYLSIGCAPCTIPVEPGQPERAGRWHRHTRMECGLHKRVEETAESNEPLAH